MRTVPMSGMVMPTKHMPMKPAIAATAASGRTYPVTRAAGGVVSAAITSHSVLGVTMMFFARSMRRIFCLPPVGKRKVYPRAEDSVTDRVAARSYHRRMRALALLVLLCGCSGGGGGG